MEKEEKVIQIAQLVEEAENESLRHLFIPILDGFETTPDTTTDKMVAVKGNTLEQFIIDGVLNRGERVEDRIEKVEQSLQDELPNKELYSGPMLRYIEDYETDFFNFKIYAQDILAGTKDELFFIRQINGYFVNPTTNEFCQISIAAGRYRVNETNKLLKDIEDLEEDVITSDLRKALMIIMDNIKYEQE